MLGGSGTSRLGLGGIIPLIVRSAFLVWGPSGEAGLVLVRLRGGVETSEPEGDVQLHPWGPTGEASITGKTLMALLYWFIGILG